MVPPKYAPDRTVGQVTNVLKEANIVVGHCLQLSWKNLF